MRKRGRKCWGSLKRSLARPYGLLASRALALMIRQPEISIEQDNSLPPNAITPFSGCLPSPIQQNKSSIC